MSREQVRQVSLPNVLGDLIQRVEFILGHLLAEERVTCSFLTTLARLGVGRVISQRARKGRL